jgi:hypothetical protein
MRYHEALRSGVARMCGRPRWVICDGPRSALLHAHENSQGSSSRGTKDMT